MYQLIVGAFVLVSATVVVAISCTVAHQICATLHKFVSGRATPLVTLERPRLDNPALAKELSAMAALFAGPEEKKTYADDFSFTVSGDARRHSSVRP